MSDQIKVSELKVNPDNPRTISESQLETLANSIRRDPEFMTLRPIVTDADGMILGGNQRYRAITERLNLSEIPKSWVVKAADLTEEQRRRFILVDNTPEGLGGDWDLEALSDGWGLDELEDLGFDGADFGDIKKDGGDKQCEVKIENGE